MSRTAFESRRTRRFFSRRPGEKDSVLNVILSVKDYMVNSMEDSVKRVYCATECEYECSECATVNYIQERIEMEDVCTRPVVLHTLHYGSVLIELADVSCSSCNETIRFDG